MFTLTCFSHLYAPRRLVLALCCALVSGATTGCISDLEEKFAGLDNRIDSGPDPGTDTATTDPDAEMPDANVPTMPTATASPGDAGPGPVIIESSPPAGAVEVATNTNTTLIFDRNIVAGEGTISLHETINDAEVEVVTATDTRVSIEDSRLTVDWLGMLSASTGYYVLLEPDAVRDEAGIPFAGVGDPTAFAFSTRAPTGLTLVETVPNNHALNVPRTRSLRFTFNEPIVAGIVGDVAIINAASGLTFELIPVTDETRVEVESERLTVNPGSIFDYGTEYYVTIDPGAVVSAQGAAFAGIVDDSALSFTTASPPPLSHATTTPADDAVGVDPNTSLVLAFDEPVVARSGEIRVHRAADGEVVEAAAIGDDNITVAGFTVTVDLGMTLETGREYYVQIDPGIVESELGAAFVGIEDAESFSFTTADAALTELTLSNTSPLADAEEVPVSTQLMLYFSEDVSVGTGFVTVFDSSDDSVVEAVNVTNAAQTLIAGDEVTVYLNAALQGSTEYHVTVSAGAFVSDSGASFGGISNATWRFTTETVFGLSETSPPDDAVGVSPATHLVMTFNDDVVLGDGAIEVRSRVDDKVIETVAASDSRVTLDGSSVSVDLDDILGSQAEYYVTVGANAVTSASGDTWTGVQGNAAWSFTTDGVNFPAGTDSSLALWLDASYTASIKTSNGVRLWADRSGKFNNVAQSSDAAKPELASGAINDRNTLRFDGDDQLQAAAGLPLTAFDGFIIWQSELTVGSSRKISLISNDRNMEVDHSHPFSSGRNAALSCVGDSCAEDIGWFTVAFTPTAAPSTPHLWNWGFNAITTSLFTRSRGSAAVVQSGPTETPVQPTTPLLIGNCTLDDCGFEGDIGEVIVYSRTLTPTERNRTVAYLRDKWGISTPSCDADEQLGDNGSCYYLSSSTATWASARSSCQGRGTGWDLATIRSQEEHAFVTSLLDANTAIGGTDATVEGTWRWVTDTLQFYDGTADAATNSAYAAWGTDAPSSSSTNNCVRYVETQPGSWSWVDYDCATASAYICEGPGN